MCGQSKGGAAAVATALCSLQEMCRRHHHLLFLYCFAGFIILLPSFLLYFIFFVPRGCGLITLPPPPPPLPSTLLPLLVHRHHPWPSSLALSLSQDTDGAASCWPLTRSPDTSCFRDVMRKLWIKSGLDHHNFLKYQQTGLEMLTVSI